MMPLSRVRLVEQRCNLAILDQVRDLQLFSSRGDKNGSTDQ